MAQFLYIFGYQTPEQAKAAVAKLEPDEVSEAIFIEAATEAQALDWGREISEAFVQQLFPGQGVSWKAQNFAHWIDRDPQQEYPAEVLSHLPAVPYGAYPDFARFKS